MLLVFSFFARPILYRVKKGKSIGLAVLLYDFKSLIKSRVLNTHKHGGISCAQKATCGCKTGMLKALGSQCLTYLVGILIIDYCCYHFHKQNLFLFAIPNISCISLSPTLHDLTPFVVDVRAGLTTFCCCGLYDDFK